MTKKTLIQNLDKCQLVELEAIFEPLNHFNDYVFWIRDSVMFKQIFTSDQYRIIWGRDHYVLYDIPLLWLETLERENYESYMQQMQFRHDRRYQRREDNLSYYQIQRPDGEKRYIRCQVIKCRCFLGNEYLMGISQNIPYEDWLNEYATREFLFTEEMKDAYALFFNLLKDNFGINELLPVSDQNKWLVLKENIYFAEEIKFSLRELQCIYYLCLGKTAKETSKALGKLSPRTVEDYLNNVRLKSGCVNKSAVISKFNRFFYDF